MTDAIHITPLGCPVPLFSELTPEQSIDTLEAVCDALHRAFRFDYLYFTAKTSDLRMERHVEAFDAWNSVKIAISHFAAAKSLSPALATVADQLSKLLQARLSQTSDSSPNSNVVWEAASDIRSEPEHDARLAQLVSDVAFYTVYLRDTGLPMPDVSDLLTEV